MKERSIILNADEVRGALDGSVTQLRRPVAEKLWPLLDRIAAYNGKPTWQCLDFDVKCPWDVERFWVKETYHVRDAGYVDGTGRDIVYKADDEDFPYGWTRSTCMPRWASRLTLDNTGVTVELNFSRWDWVIGIRRLK